MRLPPQFGDECDLIIDMLNASLESEGRSRVGWINGVKCYERLGEGKAILLMYLNDNLKIVSCAILKIVTVKCKSSAEASVIMNTPCLRFYPSTSKESLIVNYKNKSQVRERRNEQNSRCYVRWHL